MNDAVLAYNQASELRVDQLEYLGDIWGISQNYIGDILTAFHLISITSKMCWCHLTNTEWIWHAHPIKPLYTIQYCYDMHCHTWTRKTTCRENSCILGGYKTQCMNHTECSEAVKLNLDSTSSIHIFQNFYSIKIIYYYNCSKISYPYQHLFHDKIY